MTVTNLQLERWLGTSSFWNDSFQSNQSMLDLPIFSYPFAYSFFTILGTSLFPRYFFGELEQSIKTAREQVGSARLFLILFIWLLMKIPMIQGAWGRMSIRGMIVELTFRTLSHSWRGMYVWVSLPLKVQLGKFYHSECRGRRHTLEPTQTLNWWSQEWIYHLHWKDWIWRVISG